MAGIVGIFSSVPRIRNVITNAIIEPVGGSNPVDSIEVQLPNVRGQLIFEVTSGDNNFKWFINVVGGFGEFPDDATKNFVFSQNTNVNCTVRTLQINRLEITTPAADAGGRRYILQFFPLDSIPYTIRQTSVNVLGNNQLVVKVTYPQVVLN